MSTKTVDENGEAIVFPGPPKKARPAGPKESPPDKPLDSPTTKTEIERALSVCYNLIHKITHDPVRFSPSDFAEESDGLIELMQQHAHLRIVMRIAAPIAAIGAIIEKVEGTISRFRAKREATKASKPIVKPVEPTIVQPNPNGLTAEDLAKRPVFR